MQARCLLVGMVVLFVASILVSSSYARMDTESVVAIWLFDEEKGDITEDFSGNGHDGTLEGQIQWVAGRFGSALEFGASAGDRASV